METRQTILGLLACTLFILPQTPLPLYDGGQEFDIRLARYVDTRDQLARLMQLPLEATDARSATLQRMRLGAAVRSTRAEVPQGNIFSGAVAVAFRRIAGDAIESATVREWVVDRAFAASGIAHARVNGQLPLGAEHDMHGWLIRALPPLPRGLVYRVLHYDLILWDVNADYIVDILPGAFYGETL